MADEYAELPVEGVEDMIRLNNLTERVILENIRRRYNEDKIYVRAVPTDIDFKSPDV